jgi:hypothetical protein
LKPFWFALPLSSTGGAVLEHDCTRASRSDADARVRVASSLRSSGARQFDPVEITELTLTSLTFLHARRCVFGWLLAHCQAN